MCGREPENELLIKNKICNLLVAIKGVPVCARGIAGGVRVHLCRGRLYNSADTLRLMRGPSLKDVDGVVGAENALRAFHPRCSLMQHFEIEIMGKYNTVAN